MLESEDYMREFKLLAVALLTCAAMLDANGQSSGTKSKLNIVKGPTKAHLGNYAQIDVPEGYVFLDGSGYQKLLKAEGEPVSGNEVGWLKPTNAEWAVVFEFNNIGYVKDDEKNQLDAEKILGSIKRGTAEANKVREKAGNPPLEVVGWDMPPKYDESTHNLEWAIRGQCQGQQILNYNTRLLGRKGVMAAVLIVEPDGLKGTLPTMRDLLTKFSFVSGETYAEYKPGDKIAKYGLGALIVGGAAVGAAKLGLFAWLAVFLKKGWKLVVVAFAAIASMFKKMFSGRSTAPKTE